MSGLNKVMIIGRLGQDPEVKYTKTGAAVCNASVATSYKPKDGEELTEWHRVVLFGKVAEIAGQYLKKGSQVYIEGRLQTRKWEDANGNERYTTEIVAEQMQMLGGRGDNANGQSGGQYGGGGAGQQRNPPRGTQPAQPAPTDFDDDIPF